MKNVVQKSQQEMRDLLEEIMRSGVFFGARVRRRSNGRVKEWNAKSLASVRDEFDKSHDLLTVYDVEAGHPKSIALEGIEEIRCYGQTFALADE